MLNATARLALLAALVCGAGARAAVAQVTPPKEAPATVEGRVTDGERGLQGVTVALLASAPSGEFRAAARARTDHEGRYRLAGVPPGRYQLTVVAPTFVPVTRPGHTPGRRLALVEGETVEAADFQLTRGGVITGRVTDAEGRPVIAEQVHLSFAEAPRPEGPEPFYPQNTQTDDRGVYRIYGLPPGKYLVSVGHDAVTGVANPGGMRRYYRRTFHPDATEESKGRVVEVEAGGEAADVDITLGPPAKTYTASGRFVTADGRPAPGTLFGTGTLDAAGQSLGTIHSGHAADARGQFVIRGLAPGRYAVFAASADTAALPESYSDAVTFEVGEADVTGLEVRLRRAGSVSGVVQIEGADRATAARLMRQVKLYAQVETGPGVVPPSYAQVPAAPDGSFRLGGLRPGRVRFGLGWPQVPGLTLARVELNGVEQRDGFEVGDGAQLTGARVVLVFGSAVLRGQVALTNGALDDESRLVVFARRTGDDPSASFGKGAEADARGRFVIEGVVAGHYEVRARVFSRRGAGPQSPPVSVNVPESGDVTVTLALDLGAANDK